MRCTPSAPLTAAREEGYIKIDQSFVAAMTHNRDSAAIVRSLLLMATDKLAN